MTTYTVTLTEAQRGLLLHCLSDQMVRKDDGGIDVYHVVNDGSEATPGEVLALLLNLEPDPQLPDCDCRNPVCGHKASQHRGPRGACVEPGCRCGPGGWT